MPEEKEYPSDCSSRMPTVLRGCHLLELTPPPLLDLSSPLEALPARQQCLARPDPQHWEAVCAGEAGGVWGSDSPGFKSPGLDTFNLGDLG